MLSLFVSRRKKELAEAHEKLSFWGSTNKFIHMGTARKAEIADPAGDTYVEITQLVKQRMIQKEEVSLPIGYRRVQMHSFN